MAGGNAKNGSATLQRQFDIHLHEHLIKYLPRSIKSASCIWAQLFFRKHRKMLSLWEAKSKTVWWNYVKPTSFFIAKETSKGRGARGEGHGRGGRVQLWAYIGSAKEDCSDQQQKPLLRQFFPKPSQPWADISPESMNKCPTSIWKCSIH